MLQNYTLSLPRAVEEHMRVYTFAEGEQVVLVNVTEVSVQDSGDHRIKTADGHLHIIPSDWLHIDIEPATPGWTF